VFSFFLCFVSLFSLSREQRKKEMKKNTRQSINVKIPHQVRDDGVERYTKETCHFVTPGLSRNLHISHQTNITAGNAPKGIHFVKFPVPKNMEARIHSRPVLK